MSSRFSAILRARPTRFLSLVVALALLPATAWSQEISVRYQGDLIGPDRMPISGVFGLEFRLHPSADSEETLWSESHYVAVFDGEYEVELGRESPLSDEVIGQRPQLSVRFNGQEIAREPLVVRPPSRDSAAVGPPSRTVGLPEEITEVTFSHLADLALLAEEAEHAQDADRLGGRTLEEIDRYDEIARRLEDHMADPEAHGAESRRSGRRGETVLPRIGGEGGSPYDRQCPDGMVVVGLRGSAGALVDSIEVICASVE